MATRPPLTIYFITFDIAVNFINITPINVIIIATIKNDTKNNRQKPKIKNNR